MRAILLDAFGGSDVLRIGTIERPEPGPGEVLVRVMFAGINPADWKTREGMLSRYITYHFPFILGFDLAGEIAAVGPGAEGFAVGDRVFGTSMQGMGRNGSYAEFTTAYPAMLARVPDNIDLAAAAAVPTAGITAYGGLVDAGGLKAGQKVLVNGGAGGVGTYAIQIARALGADVATTCGPANLDYVRGLGAELAIDYRSEDVHAAVANWAPGGVDLVLDAVGLDSLLPKGIELVKPGGRFIEIETLISEADEVLKAAAAERGVHLGSNMVAITRAPEHLAGLAKLIADGKVDAIMPEVVPMTGVGAAHDRIKQGHVRGKIVIRIADGAEG